MFDSGDALTQFDVAVIIIILLSSVFAFIRGFIKEIMVLIGWVGAIVVTIYTFPQVADLMSDMFKSSKVVNIVALVVVFLVVLTAISLLNAMILDNLRTIRQGFIDRSLGLLFGIIRGVLVASLIHYSAVTLHEDGDGPKWLTEGETYNITAIGSNLIKDIADEFNESDIGEKAGDVVKGDKDAPEELKDSVIETGPDIMEEGKDALEEGKEMLQDKSEEIQEHAPVIIKGYEGDE